MPKVHDYKKHKKESGNKRRPGRDPHTEDLEAKLAAEQAFQQQEAEAIPAAPAPAAPKFDPYDSSHYEEPVQEDPAEEKVHLSFYGSELIRLKIPKVMEVADEVVDQWKKDGDFQGLPIGHPLAQIAAAVGLKKAKEVEKKLEEKGVFAIARMGLMYAEHELKKRGIIKK